jgi:hypothetical protein
MHSDPEFSALTIRIAATQGCIFVPEVRSRIKIERVAGL